MAEWTDTTNQSIVLLSQSRPTPQHNPEWLSPYDTIGESVDRILRVPDAKLGWLDDAEGEVTEYDSVMFDMMSCGLYL